MPEHKGTVVLLGLLACGLIAAGCGSDDSSSSSSTSAETTTTEATVSSTTTSDTGGGSTPDDVYNACIDAIEGTVAEQAGQAGCEGARTAFETCTQQAENAPEGTARDTAVAACQKAADATTAALQSGG
jgi:hypothetical protein